MLSDLGPLGAALFANLPGKRAEPSTDPEELERTLGGLLACCAAAWPGLALPPDDFLRYLGERVQDGPIAAALSSLHAEDLYLACACAQGVPAALGAFDRRYLSQLPQILGHQRPSPDFLDDVAQQLRQRLLVASPEGPPRIVDYTGRGALGGWLRIAATRTALNMRRNMDDQVAAREPEDPTRLVLPQGDAEIDYVRRRYGAEFKVAFQEALGALSAEERSLLRLHVVEGLSIDRLAPLFRVNRATVARRLQAARQGALEGTRERLRERLNLATDEFASIARVLRSQLQVSIARHLGGTEPAE